ncbi:MAG: hypothetical protein U0T73_08635 [Chitinophagales bacterium]
MNRYIYIIGLLLIGVYSEKSKGELLPFDKLKSIIQPDTAINCFVLNNVNLFNIKSSCLSPKEINEFRYRTGYFVVVLYNKKSNQKLTLIRGAGSVPFQFTKLILEECCLRKNEDVIYTNLNFITSSGLSLGLSQEHLNDAIRKMNLSDRTTHFQNANDYREVVEITTGEDDGFLDRWNFPLYKATYEIKNKRISKIILELQD